MNRKKNTPLAVLILSAGKGIRMGGRRPKVLRHLHGTPLLGHVLDTAKALRPKRVLVVVGPDGDPIRNAFPKRRLSWVVQDEPRGTGHAVSCAEEALGDFEGSVLVLMGDVPLIQPATLRRFLKTVETERSDVGVLTFEPTDPKGYGRIVRGADLSVRAIVEEKDASKSERRIGEVNAGIWLLPVPWAFRALMRVRPKGRKREWYVTDLVELAVKEGKRVSAVMATEPTEVLGANTPEQLRALRKRKRS